ncbi:transposase [Paraburkholderia sp. MM5496-R1]
MKITTVGIDLAKNVFAVHGVNEHGRTVLKKVLKRNHVAGFFANLPRVKQDESSASIRMRVLALRQWWGA